MVPKVSLLLQDCALLGTSVWSQPLRFHLLLSTLLAADGVNVHLVSTALSELRIPSAVLSALSHLKSSLELLHNAQLAQLVITAKLLVSLHPLMFVIPAITVHLVRLLHAPMPTSARQATCAKLARQTLSSIRMPLIALVVPTNTSTDSQVASTALLAISALRVLLLQLSAQQVITAMFLQVRTEVMLVLKVLTNLTPEDSFV